MHLLTAAQQDRLRHLVRRSPAFLGMRIEVHDDHVDVTHPEQLTFGFESLAARVVDVPAEQWPDLVDEHFRRGIAIVTTEAVEIDGPAADVLARTYARVIAAGGDADQVMSYADEIGPGLLRVLVYDHPDYMQFMKDDVVARYGLDQLHDAGFANLMRELPERYTERDGVYFLEGSEYVGSLVLAIPQVIEAATGEAASADGALVAMPGRDQLIFHPIRHLEGTLPALDLMRPLAAERYAGHSHQLSPWVYWWRPMPVGALDPTIDNEDFDDMLMGLDPGPREPTPLTAEQQERLQRLVRRSPAFLGMRVELHDDHVEVVAPTRLTILFASVAGIVAGAQEDQWPDLVDDYLARTIATGSGDIPVHDEAVLEHTYLRLVPGLELPPEYSCAEEVIPGLHKVLAYAMPDQILGLTDEHVRRHGADRLYEAGMRNLSRERPHEVDDADGVYQLTGSAFTASTVFVLPDVIARTTGETALPDGALVAMPDWTHLLYHVPGTADFDTAISTMSDQAVRLNDNFQAPGAIIPFVFWWRDGQLIEIADFAEDGSLRIYLWGEFEQLVMRLRS